MKRAFLYEMRFPNKKRYFGITTKFSANMRFAAHVWEANRGSRAAVHTALKKYGKENVVFRTVVIGSLDYIRELEIKVIKRYWTYDRRYGYNLDVGINRNIADDPEITRKYSEAARKAAKNRPAHWRANNAASNRRRTPAREKQWQEYREKGRSAEVEAARIEKVSQIISVSIWINNGITNKRVHKDSEMPEGWQRGRFKRYKFRRAIL